MENPNKELSDAIGKRLRLWRRSVHLTQDDMAHKLSVNKTTYRKYELGMSAPGAAVLAAACNHGVNINWLLTGLEPMLWTLDEPPDWAKDDVLEELCRTLERLRVLDPSKYEMLARGFIARSAEAREHAELKRAAAAPHTVDLLSPPTPSGFQELLDSHIMDLLPDASKPFSDLPPPVKTNKTND